MARRLIALILLCLIGCGPSLGHLILDERWRPLERMERASWVEDGVFVTRVPVIYTRSIEDFIVQPINQQNALLAHERVHAQSQAFYGLADYDRQWRLVDFRRDEEKAGWRAQIVWLVQHGEPVNPYTIAQFMSTHYDGAFTYDGALAWAADEIAQARSAK